jgi:hypothetical protein
MGDPINISHAPDPTRPAPEGSGSLTPVVQTPVSDVTPPTPPDASIEQQGAGVETGPITFEDFWTHYPASSRGKVGKGAARKRWAKIKPSVELSRKILSAVVEQRSWFEWTRDGGRFIPNAAKWLEREGWTDEPPRSPDESAGFDPEIERRRVLGLIRGVAEKLSLPPEKPKS